MPNLEWERTCWRDDYRFVVGVDEAGRGALAGPITAAAVILPPNLRMSARLRAINDSKLLTESRRDQLAVMIKSVCISWSVGSASAAEIDDLGLARANRLCMERALDDLGCYPDFALIDALTCEVDIPQIGLIDGDARSVSIAAASILAKTERDRYMRALHDRDDR